MRQSASAIAQTDRLIHQFAVRLQQPSFIMHVQANLDFAAIPWAKDKSNTTERLMGAMRVRIVPDTNLIELAIDHDVAGDDAPAMAEAIINQLMDDAKVTCTKRDAGSQRDVEQSQKPIPVSQGRHYPETYEKSACNSALTAVGMPGHLNAKDLELQNLLNRSWELQQKCDDATAPEAKAALQSQLKQLHDRISIAKQDIGALTNSMNQYLTLKADEEHDGRS